MSTTYAQKLAEAAATQALQNSSSAQLTTGSVDAGTFTAVVGLTGEGRIPIVGSLSVRSDGNVASLEGGGRAWLTDPLTVVDGDTLEIEWASDRADSVGGLPGYEVLVRDVELVWVTKDEFIRYGGVCTVSYDVDLIKFEFVFPSGTTQWWPADSNECTLASVRVRWPIAQLPVVV